MEVPYSKGKSLILKGNPLFQRENPYSKGKSFMASLCKMAFKSSKPWSLNLRSRSNRRNSPIPIQPASQLIQFATRCIEHAPNLSTKIILTKIYGLKISGKSPVDMRIPPQKLKTMLESNPLKSRILVRILAVHPACCLRFVSDWIGPNPWTFWAQIANLCVITYQKKCLGNPTLGTNLGSRILAMRTGCKLRLPLRHTSLCPDNLQRQYERFILLANRGC